MIANPRHSISDLFKPYEESLQVFAEKKRGEELTKYETNKAIRAKIDKLLHENHLIQQEIDKNTTAKEKEEINKRSEVVLEKIRIIAPDFFSKIAE